MIFIENSIEKIMKKTLLLAVAAVALLMTGCVKPDSVKIHKLENVSISLQGGTKISAIVLVENTLKRNITVRALDFVITDPAGTELAQMEVEDEVLVPKNGMSSVLLPIKVRLTDPVGGLRMLRDIDDISDRLRVTGTAMVKTGGIKKKYKFENVPLSNIIANFDPEGALKSPKII